VLEAEAAPAPGRLGQSFVEEASRWLPEGSGTGVFGGPRDFAAPSERPARILLADDNADMRAYVQRLLSETWEVEAVPDGEAALQAARAHPPDLILTDVMMPRLDGFGLIQALRAEPGTKTLPIILLSARAGEEARIEGLQAGADDYLIKPFSARELVARVSANLAISRLRREVQEQLEALLAREQQAVYSRDEFLSIASHELKTPITSLKLQLQQLQRRIDPKAPQEPEPGRIARMLESSLRQLERLTRLIEDLLDVARIRAGKLSFTFEEFSAEELFSEVLERFSDQLAEAGCRTELQLEPGLRVVWDRLRMEQVLVNLISNALKYAPGVCIQISLRAEGDQARLMVRDFGPGIPRERQAKIFERFERATSARNISGLGLGLFIASEIVAAHQGTIRVESEAGQGATFIVHLPLRPVAPLLG
jgi:signal transduction histidine kinase